MEKTARQETNSNENVYGFLVGKYDLEDYSKKISQMLKRGDVINEECLTNKYGRLVENLRDRTFELKVATEYISSRISNVTGIIEVAKVLDETIHDFEVNGLEIDGDGPLDEAEHILLRIENIDGTLFTDREKCIYAMADILEYYFELDEAREFFDAVYLGYYEREENINAN